MNTSFDPDQNPEAVIFDLDGTLLDTIGDLADAMNHVLGSNGFPLHEEATYFGFIGNGMVNLVARALPDEVAADPEALAQYTSAFRARYSDRWNIKTGPYEGIPAVLDALSEKGVPMGVCSNKPHALTKKCIEGILSEWRFGCVLGHSDAFPRKPDPASAEHVASSLGASPGRTWFVGDSGVDMMTARNAGMVAVGVLWGFRSSRELKEHGAEIMVDSPNELLELIAGTL